MNRRLAFDNRLCYERDVVRQQALHLRKLEQVVPTSQSPSRVYLDSSAPVPQPHLATNAKRQQLERDRQLAIYHQNQRLASKMEQIMNRQENLVLAASSSRATRSRLAQRGAHKDGERSMPSVPTHADSKTSPPRVPRKPVHSPAHVHMPGIRLDSTQTPLLDCHLSPEYAMGRGDACKKPSLVNRAVQKRRQNVITQENRRLKERLAHLKPYYNTKKWDGEWQEHAHKFSHLHQDGTVGYLLPHAKLGAKKALPLRQCGSQTVRATTTDDRELPSLGKKSKGSSSRAGRLKQLHTRDDDCEEYPQVRDLPPCLLLEATTRQGVEVAVAELQIELIRSDIAELADRGLMVHGSWKGGLHGDFPVSHDMLVQVAQIVDDLEIMIKLETVSQVSNAGNVPSLSTLLTDDELQKLLVGVVQQLRFQVAPTPPNATSNPLIISWGLPMKSGDNNKSDGSKSPRERLRPRTCPSTMVSGHDQQASADTQDEDYEDDYNEYTERSGPDVDIDPREIDWAVRFNTAASLNKEGKKWRSVICRQAARYLVSSWFEEETSVQTIKALEVGNETNALMVEITYSFTEMQELLRQLQDGLVTVPALLERALASQLPPA